VYRELGWAPLDSDWVLLDSVVEFLGSGEAFDSVQYRVYEFEMVGSVEWSSREVQKLVQVKEKALHLIRHSSWLTGQHLVQLSSVLETKHLAVGYPILSLLH
jgi:hypothetical protein